MTSIREFLNVLKNSTLNHVIIDGYHELERRKNVAKIVILCEDSRSIVTATHVEPFSSATVKNDGLHKIQLGNYQLIVAVYEKGKGVFPERFETELLAGRIVANGVEMYKPDEDREFLSQLYMEVVHKGNIGGAFRAIALKKITYRIGMPTKPKYTSLKFYNSPELPPDKVSSGNSGGLIQPEVGPLLTETTN